ncbi:MFS transporter [Lactobacillus kullabergensis]|nr:MFS transporter [Lactobacillus kullabergensis]
MTKITKLQKIYPWIIIIASGLLMSLLEYTYTLLFSLFLNPLVHSLNSRMSIVSLYYTLISFSIAAMLPLINKIIAKISLCKITLTAIIVGAISIWYFSHITKVWELYILAVIVGICSATCGTVVQGIVLNNWFVSRKNLAFTMGSFVSTIYLLIMTPVLTYLISIAGWRQTMFMLSWLTLIIGIPCSLIMKGKPQDVGIKPYGFDKCLKRNTNSKTANNSKQLKKLWLSQPFILTLIFFIAITFASNMNQLFPTYAVKVGFGAAIGGLMETIMTGIDILVTPVFAITTEKFGGAKSLPVWLFLGLCTFPLLILATVKHEPIFALVSAVGADILTDIYGPGEQIFAKDILGKDFAAGYSCINSITYLVGAFAVPAVSLVYELSLNWNMVFILGIILLIIMLLVLFWGYHKVRI